MKKFFYNTFLGALFSVFLCLSFTAQAQVTAVTVQSCSTTSVTFAWTQTKSGQVGYIISTSPSWTQIGPGFPGTLLQGVAGANALEVSGVFVEGVTYFVMVGTNSSSTSFEAASFTPQGGPTPTDNGLSLNKSIFISGEDMIVTWWTDHTPTASGEWIYPVNSGSTPTNSTYGAPWVYLSGKASTFDYFTTASGSAGTQGPTLKKTFSQDGKYDMIFAYKYDGTSASWYSPYVRFPFVQLVSAPAISTASATGETTASVSWASNAYVTNWRLYYSTSSTFSSNQYVDVTGTSANLSGLTAATTYYVRLAAQGPGGDYSTPGASKNFTTQGDTPQPGCGDTYTISTNKDSYTCGEAINVTAAGPNTSGSDWVAIYRHGAVPRNDGGSGLYDISVRYYDLSDACGTAYDINSASCNYSSYEDNCALSEGYYDIHIIDGASYNPKSASKYTIKATKTIKVTSTCSGAYYVKVAKHLYNIDEALNCTTSWRGSNISAHGNDWLCAVKANVTSTTQYGPYTYAKNSSVGATVNMRIGTNGSISFTEGSYRAVVYADDAYGVYASDFFDIIDQKISAVNPGTTSAVASWDAKSNAHGWKVGYNTTNSTTGITIVGEYPAAVTSATIPGLHDDTQYYAFLAALDQDGNVTAWSGGKSFYTNPAGGDEDCKPSDVKTWTFDSDGMVVGQAPYHNHASFWAKSIPTWITTQGNYRVKSVIKNELYDPIAIGDWRNNTHTGERLPWLYFNFLYFTKATTATAGISFACTESPSSLVTKYLQDMDPFGKTIMAIFPKKNHLNLATITFRQRYLGKNYTKDLELQPLLSFALVSGTNPETYTIISSINSVTNTFTKTVITGYQQNSMTLRDVTKYWTHTSQNYYLAIIASINTKKITQVSKSSYIYTTNAKSSSRYSIRLTYPAMSFTNSEGVTSASEFSASAIGYIELQYPDFNAPSINNPTVSGSSATVTWTGNINGAAGKYNVSFHTDKSNPAGGVITTNVAAQTLTKTLSAGTYYASVQEVYCGCTTDWTTSSGTIVVEAGRAPTVVTTTVDVYSATSALVGGNVTDNGGSTVTARGVVYSTTNTTPTLGGEGCSTFAIGSGTGVFSNTLTGLTPAIKYYVRAYATNSTATGYGSIVNFTTSAGVPTVTASAATDVAYFNATLNGNITSFNGGAITDYGFYYGTTSACTQKAQVGTSMASPTAFNKTIEGLEKNTKYYFKAYATNSAGITYSDVLDFTTGTASLSTDKDTYLVGEAIMVTANGLNPSTKDWVGLYIEGESPQPGEVEISLYCYYVNVAPNTAHQINQDSHWNVGDPGNYHYKYKGPIAGRYTLYLLENDGYTVLASKEITVAGDYELSSDKVAYNVGDPIMVSANAPNDYAWVALYHKTSGLTPATPTSITDPISIYWMYANNANPPAGEELAAHAGGATVDIATRLPNATTADNKYRDAYYYRNLPAGDYRLYLLDGDYVVKKTKDIIIQPTYGASTILPPASVAFNSTTSRLGIAGGTVTITKPSTFTPQKYNLYWGDADGKLNGYTAFRYVAHEGNTQTYTIDENVMTPAGATRILVYSVYDDVEGNTYTSVDLPSSATTARNLGALKNEFQVLSDIHINNNQIHPHDQHFINALTAIKSISPESDGIFINGDIADHGNASEYTAYRTYLKNKGYTAGTNAFAAIGNHDFYDGTTIGSNNPNSAEAISQFLTGTGQTAISGGNVYFDKWIDDMHFIFLGSEAPDVLESGVIYATISQTQIDWFTTAINATNGGNKAAKTFIFLHQGIKNTVAGTSAAEGWYGIKDTDAAKLKAIMKTNPEAVLFTSHSHREMLSDKDIFTRSSEVDNLPNILNTASNAYLWNWYDMSSEDARHGQGYFFYVYEKGIVVKGYDFVDGKYIASAQFCIGDYVIADADEYYYTDPITVTASSIDKYRATENSDYVALYLENETPSESICPIYWYDVKNYSETAVVINDTEHFSYIKTCEGINPQRFAQYGDLPAGDYKLVLLLDGGYVVGSEYHFTINSAPLITYSVNGNTSLIPAERYRATAVNLPNAPAPNGYVFAGWNNAEVASYTSTAPTYAKGGTIEPTEDITIYATFQETRSEKYATAYEVKSSQIIDTEIVWDGNFSIESSNIITITSDARLTVTGLLGTSITSQIVVEEGGELAYLISGVPATVKRHIEPSTPKAQYDMKWYLIGSPFDNLTIAGSPFITDPKSSYALYRYNESKILWENYKNTDYAETFTIFENGRGYLYANTVERDLEISGNTVTGSVDFEMSYLSEKEEYRGWNIIANPYLHDITMGEGCAIDPSDLLAEGYYQLYADGTWSTKLTTEPIMPQQGVMVRALKEGTLTMNDVVPTKSRAQENFIRVKISDGTHNDLTYGVLREGNDLLKTAHYNSNLPMVYTIRGSRAYAINYLGENATQMSVSVVVTEPSTMKMSVETNVDFEKLFLLDRVTGVEQDLKLDGKYEFTTDNNSTTDRFLITFDRGHYGIDEETEEGYHINIVNGKVVIDGLSSGAQIQIFDLLGRLVVNQEANNISESIDMKSFKAGAYVVRIINGEDSFVEKIVVEK